MTPRRAMAALAAVLVVVGVLAVDAAIAARVADRIAVEVGRELQDDVAVDVGGLLPGLQALGGRIPVVDLRAADVVVGDPAVRLDLLSVRLTGLVVEADAPVAGEGTFRAVLEEAAVRGAAPAELAPLLSLDGDVLRVGVGPLSVPVELAATGQALVVSVEAAVPLLDDLLAGGLPVPLDVPAGVAVTGAAVADGRLVLTGSLDPVALVSGS